MRILWKVGIEERRGREYVHWLAMGLYFRSNCSMSLIAECPLGWHSVSTNSTVSVRTVETKVHLCGELYALRPRLVAGGPEHGAYFVYLISFAAAREQWSKGQLRHDAANSKNIDGGVVRAQSSTSGHSTSASRRSLCRRS